MQNLLPIALLCCGVLGGCAPVLPRVEATPDVPGLGTGQKRLEASFKAAQASCRAEEARLREAAEDGASTRRIAETFLALGAGSLATGAAIYAGLDPTPKGYVIVPLAVGAAAGTVPLGALLATDRGDVSVDERQARIRDRQLVVRDAVHGLAEATADRERAEAALGELERRLHEQHNTDARRHAEAADPTAFATIDAVGATMREAKLAELTYARQREQDAQRALGDALIRLGEVCGKGVP